MANLGSSFDPNSVEPDSGGRVEPFAEGRYLLQVTDSDVVDNSKGSGQILKLTIEVADGPLTGRKMFENINITNASVQAQEIGQKQLSALCHAAGITHVITDSQELHFHPFEADVGIEAGSGTNPKTDKPYPPKNKITKYHFEEASAPARAAATPARAAPAPDAATRPAPAAAGARPWQRKTA